MNTHPPAPLPSTASAAVGGPPDPRHALGQSVGFAAFIWAYPLVETLRTCRLRLSPGRPGVTWTAPIDRLNHTTRVTTAAERDVVTPANDLLYTATFLNLADGPRLLRVPASARHPGRYFVLALYDAWTNNFANPGSRESPPDGETVVLVGPDMAGDAPLPAGRVVRSPTNLVWMIGRVLAGEGDDVLAAQALQREIGLEPLPGTDLGRWPAGVEHWVGEPEDTMAALQARPADAEAISAAFFTNLCRSLVDQAVPGADAGLLAYLGLAGLVPGAAFDFAQLPAAVRAGLQQGLVAAAASIEAGSRSRKAKPWATHFGLGRYGTAYLTRALTAYKGLGALAPEEAVYAMGDYDAQHQPLDGRHRYVLRFEPGDWPPVDGFWSVTLYDADRFLYPNAFGRHAIGDRTPGLQRDADGGLSLHIAHQAPPDRSNWLPAPAGSFYVILRLYAPRPELRTWPMPPLRRLD